MRSTLSVLFIFNTFIHSIVNPLWTACCTHTIQQQQQHSHCHGDRLHVSALQVFGARDWRGDTIGIMYSVWAWACLSVCLSVRRVGRAKEFQGSLVMLVFNLRGTQG